MHIPIMVSKVVLPGDAILGLTLPASKSLHPASGLYRESSASIISTLAGSLEQNPKQKTAHVSVTNARYIPRVGDLVIAQVQRSSMDFFHLSICPHTSQAILPQLAFEGASKKTRPQLKPNDLVYAKVVSANKNMEVELTCVNPSTGKAEPEGLGPVTGGTVFGVSTGLATRLLTSQNVVILEELGRKMVGGFEIAVGKNGKVWVDCPESGVQGICAVGRCLQETDSGSLGEDAQQKLVKKVVKQMRLG
jgi:exosome complex component RRP40